VFEIFPVVIEIFCGFIVICNQILGWNSQVGPSKSCPLSIYGKFENNMPKHVSMCVCVFVGDAVPSLPTLVADIYVHAPFLILNCC